jgi:hypothetical protein
MEMFHFWDVSEDDSFVPEADPTLHKIMTRTAGASIMQDIGLNTYWANTVGKSPLKHTGPHAMLKQELEENLSNLLCTRMSYRQIEEFMVVIGYESGDIRHVFQHITGIDPVKLDYMRAEDIKNTPSNIPAYSLGWGYAKKGDSSYFVMPYAGGIFMVFHQEDDLTRKEDKSFLRVDEAMEYLSKVVRNVHRYDMPAMEQADASLEKMVKEPQKKDYMVLAKYLDSLNVQGKLSSELAQRLVRDAVRSGSLTPEEGEIMLQVRADNTGATSDIGSTPQHTQTTPDQTGTGTELSDAQKDRVIDKMEMKTPQDFFNATLPDRVEEVASEHVKGVLTYIANRESDMSDFEAKLYRMEYKRHESPKALVEVDPESGRRSGPPASTVSVVLELHDKTLPKEKNRKFALAVFFVGADNEVTTSDSIKGEDNIIYGFTEDGLRQYFAKERSSLSE